MKAKNYGNTEALFGYVLAILVLQIIIGGLFGAGQPENPPSNEL